MTNRESIEFDMSHEHRGQMFIIRKGIKDDYKFPDLEEAGKHFGFQPLNLDGKYFGRG
jgi:hypothetical protein